MNKADLKKAVAADTGLTQKDAGIAIDAVLENIKAGLVEDGKVTLVGFGTLNAVIQAPRKARNPKTGEAIDVPEKVVVKFKPAAAFKEAALGANLPVKATKKVAEDEVDGEVEAEDGE